MARPRYIRKGPCGKVTFRSWVDAMEQATFDRDYHGQEKKVYMCHRCGGWHTATERVKTNVALSNR